MARASARGACVLQLSLLEIEALVDVIVSDRASELAAAVSYASGDELESLGRKIILAAKEAGMDDETIRRSFGLPDVEDTDEEGEVPRKRLSDMDWPHGY